MILLTQVDKKTCASSAISDPCSLVLFNVRASGLFVKEALKYGVTAEHYI